MNPFRGKGYFLNIDGRERLVSKKVVGLADTRPIWLSTSVLHHRLRYTRISGMYKRQLYAL
jgi:hypothetical protein